MRTSTSTTKVSKTATFLPKVVYLPMTADVLTPGHIMVIRYLQKSFDKVIIGLLTDHALKGYKKNVMVYKDRQYMLKNIGWNGIPIKVVCQDSLNPYKNIARYMPSAIASGDGFEEGELRAAKNFNLKIVNVKLPGEKKRKLYASSALKDKIRKVAP